MIAEDLKKYNEIKEEVRIAMSKKSKLPILLVLIISRLILVISNELTLWLMSLFMYALFFLFGFLEFTPLKGLIFLVVHFFQWELSLKKRSSEIVEDGREFEFYIIAYRELKEDQKK